MMDPAKVWSSDEAESVRVKFTSETRLARPSTLNLTPPLRDRLTDREGIQADFVCYRQNAELEVVSVTEIKICRAK